MLEIINTGRDKLKSLNNRLLGGFSFHTAINTRFLSEITSGVILGENSERSGPT